MKKIIRITTVPITMKNLIAGQMKYMSGEYKFVAVSSQDEYLQQVSQESGARTLAINMTRTISPLSDLVSLFKLFFMMVREKPYIVHTHTPKAGFLGMLAARMARVPVRMHTVCGMPLLETRGSRKKLLEFVEKLTYACAHKVYPNSRNLMDIIRSEGYCDQDKLKVIGNGSSNGINCDRFSPGSVSEDVRSKLRTELNIAESDFVFCFVGRIVSAKGIRELIRAFVSISKERSNVKLLIIGFPEPDLDPLDEETTHQLGNHPGIRNVPYQKDIRPYLAISSLFVFPSYREGFPNVVMEAGAMGLPCVVSDINGCNEIIQHGVNGFIVPVKDEHALEEAMNRFLDDPEMLASMKKVARPMIESRYSQTFVWKEILNEYRLQEQEVAKERYVPKFN